MVRLATAGCEFRLGGTSDVVDGELLWPSESSIVVTDFFVKSNKCHKRERDTMRNVISGATLRGRNIRCYKQVNGSLTH